MASTGVGFLREMQGAGWKVRSLDAREYVGSQEGLKQGEQWGGLWGEIGASHRAWRQLGDLCASVSHPVITALSLHMHVLRKMMTWKTSTACWRRLRIPMDYHKRARVE